MRVAVIYISLVISIISLILTLIEMKATHEYRLLIKEIHSNVFST